ncbi:CatB-related O-acetyltransferase [Cognatishimia sp. SS12]|uniref:CatB-related O-acetyltransferase n=1 Tax=Cognatishimia sp. SS12 TaxID=2979465 RepID=UPI00232D0843|nr:CatB-related O-acetyltransferase [Cognatishimia sp. SS12]MDC0738404.1 CatB-related O-acetyltransferase [Cognatishimia sp. SS12]
MPFPDPTTVHPIKLQDGTVHKGTVFLKAALTHPRIEVGDYTYMSDHTPLLEPGDIAERLAPYLWDFAPERLIIGKFCQLAAGAQFITASANHRYDGLSSFPFLVFGGGWEGRASRPAPGADTRVGNDVWIGAGAKIMPGVTIGDGAIIAAGAVVASDVAPYTIVGGNPARLIRARLSEEDAAEMQRIAWWDWPIAHITAHEAEICGADLAGLAAAAPVPGK